MLNLMLTGWNTDTSECEWSGDYTDSDDDGVPDKAPVEDEAVAVEATI